MSTNGQAKVLTHDEIARLFGAMDSPRDKALFGIMLYCGLRVSEAISLRPGDIKGDVLVLPAKATKGKLATRQIDSTPDWRRCWRVTTTAGRSTCSLVVMGGVGWLGHRRTGGSSRRWSMPGWLSWGLAIAEVQWMIELFEHINLALVLNIRQSEYLPLLHALPSENQSPDRRARA